MLPFDQEICVEFERKTTTQHCFLSFQIARKYYISFMTA